MDNLSHFCKYQEILKEVTHTSRDTKGWCQALQVPAEKHAALKKVENPKQVE